MTLKYYVDHRSGSCRRVSAVIDHLNIEVEEINIDLLSGESQSEAFLAINPFGMVPLLIDDKPGEETVILSEASAIMIYLCEKVGDNSLWPAGKERIEVVKWMFWAAEHFRQPAPIYFTEKIAASLQGRSANAQRLDYADQIMNRHAPCLDAHLRGRDYVVGKALTLADFDLAAPLSHMMRSHVPYDKFPSIRRWEYNLNENIDAWKLTGDILNFEMNKLYKNDAA